MARKRITARPSWFGYTCYYDEKGKCVGKSRPGAFGTTVYFDERGRIAGKSHKGFLAKEVFHDKDHKRSITTYEGIIGEIHYENGKLIGRSMPGWLGTECTTLETEDVQKDYDLQLQEEYVEEDWLYEEEEYKDAIDCDVRETENEDVTSEGIVPNTAIRNILVFLACILVCGVIFAIAALRR